MDIILVTYKRTLVIVSADTPTAQVKHKHLAKGLNVSQRLVKKDSLTVSGPSSTS